MSDQNHDRQYPKGPVSCGMCIPSALNDEGVNVALKEMCFLTYGKDGCTPLVSGPSSFYWIFLMLLWLIAVLYSVFWCFMKRYLIEKRKYERLSRDESNSSNLAASSATAAVASSLSSPATMHYHNANGIGFRRSSSFQDFISTDEFDVNEENAKTTAAAAVATAIDGRSTNKDAYISITMMNEKARDERNGLGSQVFDLSTQIAENMVVRCYKSTVYEDIGLSIFGILSSVHILYLLIGLFDYYYGCEIKSIDNFCFFGKFVIFGGFVGNGISMFIVWWMSVIWFLFLITFYESIRNWLRFPSDPEEATHVRVWIENEVEELSARPTKLMKIGRSIESCFERVILRKNRPGHSQTVPIKTSKYPNGELMRYFEFECARYMLPPRDAPFQVAPTRIRAVALGGNPEFGAVLKHALGNHTNGLSSNEALALRDMIGMNEIAFTLPSFGEAIRIEFFSVFYLYQFASYVIWLWFGYLYVGIWLFSIVLISAFANIHIKLRNLKKILSLTIHHDHISIKRNGQWIQVDAKLLVPGDLVRVETAGDSKNSKGWRVPADLILVQGSCATDESGLTGESMPVAKSAIDKRDSDVTFNILDKRCVKHVLFAGTVVLETSNRESENDILAMVMATGIDTSRGELISNILYPAPMRFQYDEEFPIALLFLTCYAMFSLSLSIYYIQRNGQQTNFITRWIYAMYSISQMISPMLKISLSVGQIKASERLSKKSVSCINPPRIAISGKVRVFCFDKTGTLTKEGLEFVGVQGIDTTETKLFQVSSKSFSQQVEQALACCHAVTSFRGKFLGNAVEVSMFQAVKWSLSSDNQSAISPNGTSSLKIVRRFEFDHARMTMSVVVASSFEQGRLISFCKGAPEKIASICDPKTVPSDFLEQAHAHAMDGCYVLGLARSKNELNVSLLKKSIQSTTGTVEDFDRDEIEHDLECIGLLLFRNELKDDTAAAITELKNGAVRPVMVTGDNAACGQYIARASGMIARSTSLLLGECDPIQNVVKWKSMNSSSHFNQESFEQSIVNREMTTNDVIQLFQSNPLAAELAMTGKAFNLLSETEAIRQLLPYIRIYARMSPHNKIRVVKLYMEEGLVVGMCGDGGNDVGALRIAHVGMALSEAEASVVAPFTSGTKSVQSAVDLLREGRASLANSFAGYKFLVQYGLLFSVAKIMSYRFGIVMSMAQYLTMDLLVVLSLGYAMTLCEPLHVLGRQQPTASLLGFHTVSSVIGTFLISVIVIGINIGIMSASPNYVRWPAYLSKGTDWWTNGDAWEATTIFCSIFICFVSAAFAFSFGGPFRKNVFRNYVLILWVTGFFAVALVLLLCEPNTLTRAYHIASEPFNAPNTTSSVWMLYQRDGGSPSPGMDISVRFGMCISTFLFGFFGIISWEIYFVNGAIGRKFTAFINHVNQDEIEARKWTNLEILSENDDSCCPTKKVV